MITSYSTDITTATGELLPFNIDYVKTSKCIAHEEGGTSFTITRPGIYGINFIANVADNTTTTGTVTVRMYNNGVAVPTAVASAISASASAKVNMGFTTLFKVNPSCIAVDNRAKLTFVNDGVDAIFDDYTVTIVRLN